MGALLELFILLAITVFVILYRQNPGENVYKFFVTKVSNVYNKYAPYSFKVVREKAKELGQEYTPRQYATQVLIISGLTAVISYFYFYSIIVTLIYILISMAFIDSSVSV